MLTLQLETRMRLRFAVALLFAAACVGEATAPGSSVITVRLRDDRGAAAARNPVIVALSPTSQFTGVTNSDGTVNLRIPNSGTYQVKVLPRSEYIWTAALVRNIDVAANSTVVVDFTLYRGNSPTDPWIEP
jgi:hypothetical protein